METYVEQAKELLLLYGPSLLMAILTLLVGLWIIKLLGRFLSRSMNKSNIEPSLQRFLVSFVSTLLKLLLFISVASMIGIATTSFVAILGAAGLAVGLALQGSLANFAGGVLILLFKPYKIGDFVDAQGVMGTVREIQVFNTILLTPDNRTIIIPNGAISNGIITNFSTQPTRRVDMAFGIGYGDDIDKAREILNKLIGEDARVLPDPQPVIVVTELADSSVNFAVRAWCQAGDYWGIFFDMQEKVKKSFDEAGISIPFPQRDIHVYNHSS